jgi:hypothetical protein
MQFVDIQEMREIFFSINQRIILIKNEYTRAIILKKKRGGEYIEFPT